jgi:predicted metal-dependent phosphoesterase TrpH
MILDIDLHTHSTASDGRLAPAELVAAARAAGVRRLALTDHDTVAGLPEARVACEAHGVELIPGLELSCRWKKLDIHVCGLWIDPLHPALARALSSQSERREDRGERIARRLGHKRMPGALAGARRVAGEAPLGRPHFARWMVDAGHVPDLNTAFRRWLGAGAPAGVATEWPELAEGIAWLHAAGGLAVLAHPLKYRLTATRLRALLADFAEAGGDGLEVSTVRMPPEERRRLAGLARRNGLRGSAGSDFHGPVPWQPAPGGLPPLPEGLEPVWSESRGDEPLA